MSVKIVTDSASDLPPEVAKELDITIIPLNVNCGDTTCQEGANITTAEFYRKSRGGIILPSNSAPAPEVFIECYRKLGCRDGVVSIHVSSKLSGTYSAAVSGMREANVGCRIEVIDSFNLSMGLGLLAVTAAKASRAGATIDEIVTLVKGSVGRIWAAGTLDSLELLQRGGRISKAGARLRSVLNVKPVLAVKYGEVVPLDRVRTHHKALERLSELMEAHLPAREAGVVYSTEPEEAESLAAYVMELFPEQRVLVSRFGPVLGAYVGPRALGVFTLK